MERGLKVPLSPNEEITLRRVAYGIAHRETLRSADVFRLEILGLIADSDGVLSLTPIGRQRLAGLPAGASDGGRRRLLCRGAGQGPGRRKALIG